MKKILLVILIVFIGIQISGCAGWLIRTSTSRQPRVDQEISGNRGFIFGEPDSEPKEPTFTDRKIYRIEIEIPQLLKKKKSAPQRPSVRPPKEDKVLWGNRGYIFGGPGTAKAVEEVPTTYQPEPEQPPALQIEEETPQVLDIKPEETPQIRTYEVRKGDTLQKISHKFYGTSRKWILLYNANKNKLKSPDRVYPGQVLVIPEVEEFKK